jgi:hypothetical protein
MHSTFRQLCRPLIALSAIVLASLASDASACEMVKAKAGACVSVCECCTPAAPVPASRFEVAQVATTQPIACQTAPGTGCPCQVREPGAPEPRPTRNTDVSRSAQDLGLNAICLGDAAEPRDLRTPEVAPIQSPPNVPLYLRNARLLF